MQILMKLIKFSVIFRDIKYHNYYNCSEGKLVSL